MGRRKCWVVSQLAWVHVIVVAVASGVSQVGPAWTDVLLFLGALAVDVGVAVFTALLAINAMMSFYVLAPLLVLFFALRAALLAPSSLATARVSMAFSILAVFTTVLCAVLAGCRRRDTADKPRPVALPKAAPIVAALLMTASSALRWGANLRTAQGTVVAYLVFGVLVYFLAPFGLVMFHLCHNVSVEQAMVLLLPVVLVSAGYSLLLVASIGVVAQFPNNVSSVLGLVSHLFAVAACIILLVYAIVLRRAARKAEREGAHHHNRLLRDSVVPAPAYQPVPGSTDSVPPEGSSEKDNDSVNNSGSGSYQLRASYGTTPINSATPVLATHNVVAPGVSYAYPAPQLE